MKKLICNAVAGLTMAFAGAAMADGKPGHAEFGAVDENRDGRVSKVEAQAYTELTSQFVVLDESGMGVSPMIAARTALHGRDARATSSRCTRIDPNLRDVVREAHATLSRQFGDAPRHS